VLKLYRSLWRFASYSELLRIILSSVITGIFHTVAITVFFRRMPISYYVMGIVFQTMFVLAVRFSYRFVLLLRKNENSDLPSDRVMIIGAGSAGQSLIRDIAHSDKTGGQRCAVLLMIIRISEPVY